MFGIHEGELIVSHALGATDRVNEAEKLHYFVGNEQNRLKTWVIVLYIIRGSRAMGCGRKVDREP